MKTVREKFVNAVSGVVKSCSGQQQIIEDLLQTVRESIAHREKLENDLASLVFEIDHLVDENRALKEKLEGQKR